MNYLKAILLIKVWGWGRYLLMRDILLFFNKEESEFGISNQYKITVCPHLPKEDGCNIRPLIGRISSSFVCKIDDRMSAPKPQDEVV